MVRDMDLVRRIVLAIEAGEFVGFAKELEMPDEDPRAVSYHLQLLKDAEYIEAREMTTLNAEWPEIWPSRMTWQGHEFLDAARNETVWRQTWDVVKARGGGIAVEVLKQLLVKVSTQYFLGTP